MHNRKEEFNEVTKLFQKIKQILEIKKSINKEVCMKPH